MARLFLVFALLLASGANARDIAQDLGGLLEPRLVEVAALRHASTPIRITGTCASSCTLYLGLPQTCVTPRARLGFHAPAGSTGHQGLPLAEFLLLQQAMADHYPAPMAAWFLQGPGQSMDGVTWLSGREAVALGARAC